jgi:CRISPR-associated endonuclease Csn1
MDQKQPVILGIDLGAKSIGWAVMAADVDEAGHLEPVGLLNAGARCFEAGVDGNLEQGKDEARAVARRMQRGMRRQLYRRAQRLRRSLRALAECGFLPGAVASPPEARHDYLSKLDERLKALMLADGEPAGPVQDSPIYQIRRRCLEGKRTLEEIGRAFFHLAQRRGFKSNRKDTSKDDEKGKVKSGIANLAKEINTIPEPRTLGKYLSTLDPHQTRIRNRWAARSMYEDEFNAIWTAQAHHHPQVMTGEAKTKIHHAIFHQRPLKSSADLIGFCELETRRRRAPMGCLIFQRFRIVQKINDLTWRDENGAICGPLSIDDPRRAALIDCLDRDGDLTMAAAKKMLGLHKKATFLLEEGAAKILPGNRTVVRLKPALGQHWENWTAGQREAFVNELISDIEQSEWEDRLVKHWKLSKEEAGRVADLGLQSGYASLSRRAMRRLLAEMEAGVPYATAVKKLYGDRAKGRPALEKLPGVLEPGTRKYLGKINNPAVVRALTELRKIVNAIVLKYGKPVRIRIELARDIRNTRKQRQNITQTIKDRTGEREDFKKSMATKLPGLFGGRDASRSDVEKWALAEECNWVCPYTGKCITPETLFGAHAEFDVEHIIPRSRRPDDSFANKTICHVDENRAKKGNKTPFEAYHGGTGWNDILARVKRFQGSGARGKLRLFEVETIDEGFTNRDLNDTRYASRLAKDYLGLLYGGGDGIDPSGTRCVQACCGQITATLRNEMGLNKILSDDGEKNRQDHRHHAVDAVAIALAGPRAVQILATAAARAAEEGRRRYAYLPEPWAGFRSNVQEVVERIVVSHRVNQTLSGAMHEGTNFSAAKSRANSKTGKVEEVRHVRKKLIGISPGQVENIVDPRVRKAVMDFLDGRDPKAVFKEGSKFPTLLNRNNIDRPVPIRRVRVWEKNRVISIGKGGATRHVAPGENNHLEIVASTDKRGKENWDISNIVSRYEAYLRLSAGEPIVKRNWNEGHELVLTLRRGDCLELDIVGIRQVMRVTSIGVDWIQTQPLSYGAPKMEKEERNSWLFRSGKGLQAANPRKVSISPIGEVRPCNE